MMAPVSPISVPYCHHQTELNLYAVCEAESYNNINSSQMCRKYSPLSECHQNIPQNVLHVSF